VNFLAKIARILPLTIAQRARTLAFWRRCLVWELVFFLRPKRAELAGAVIANW
jgi:hypothetical protein